MTKIKKPKNKTLGKANSRSLKPLNAKKRSGVSAFKGVKNVKRQKSTTRSGLVSKRSKKNSKNSGPTKKTKRKRTTRKNGYKIVQHAYSSDSNIDDYEITRGDVSIIGFRDVVFPAAKSFSTTDEALELFDKYLVEEFKKFVKENGYNRIYGGQYRFKFPRKKFTQFRNLKRKRIKSKKAVEDAIFDWRMRFKGSMSRTKPIERYFFGNDYLRFVGVKFEVI